ncbi:Y-family DNA polymerase [Jiulongibacter sediminis]|uniref:SOS mutagenesis and repair protein UmuC n=1 Tax=Jiulongibacter sediminis TaxID=1605367 RepID=A0A0P7BI80_9BACT|nr:Y-family DNA polymerase [Jiulongibacter sediminis]KPM46798.1 SOS mutagenesis and repair protein UmuC [Jiulongibacter sediminis]TBX21703.1 SOS mutagenesis and repair protein UmuC [Jiulongibacter sediminis]
MYALIDCNNFYASCERLFRPELNGKPIVVLSNNDGCVIARSDEAKAIGIPMGAPAFEFEQTFLQNKVHVFSSNYALYGDMSNRVMSMLGEFAPEIEIYSIDEAFLHFKGFEKYDLSTYGSEIREKVTKGTGIPISIGFAPTKALAKVANKVAKKYPGLSGNVYCIDSEEKRIKALKWLKVGDVWGIGAQHEKRLKNLAIHTAYDFSEMNSSWVKNTMSIVGLRLQKELQGIPCLSMEEIQPKQNIAVTRSFEKNIKDFGLIRERVSTFAVTCAEKLRNQNSCCNTMMVFVLTNPFRRDLPQYRNNLTMQLPFPSNSSIELAEFAEMGLRKIYREGYEYKKAGVMVMNLTPEQNKQVCLFGNTNPIHQPAMQVIDGLNARLGMKKVKLASQNQGRTFKMRQEKLSPYYTTRLSDVIRVKA